MLKVPREVRDSEIRGMVKAINNGKARNAERSVMGEGEVKEQFTFRTACMEINKERIPSTASCAVKVSMDKLGRVFISFVKEVVCKSET